MLFSATYKLAKRLIFTQRRIITQNGHYTIHIFVLKHEFSSENKLYIARDILSFSNKPGAGTFYFDQRLVLTKNEETRSIWELPSCFSGEEKNLKFVLK